MMATILQSAISTPYSDRLKALSMAPRLLDVYSFIALHDMNDSLICALILILMSRFATMFPDKIFSYEDPLASRVTNGAEEDLQQNEEKKHLALTESLKSSIDHLNKELERMENENLLLPVDDNSNEPSFPGLQRELMQLHEANQELGSIFPMFNEISVSGNALERVLALEVELAEALQAKKKSSLQFQSAISLQ